MSRVGKKPINISDVTVNIGDNTIKVKGKLGELQMNVHPNVKLQINDKELLVLRENDLKENRADRKSVV